MSTMVTKKREKADRLVDLLKEYTDRLNALSLEAEKTFQLRKTGPTRLADTKIDLVERHVQVLAPAIEDLSRHVSQMIEHGNLDDVTRLEYRLRLADLEHALATAQRLPGEVHLS